ncbi:MAG TPA: hypothetical protein VFV38_33085 [Ktedonobacteraceae bacterium]|nr:hypothetical protein [Ktedonobacteraceae bacterium]
MATNLTADQIREKAAREVNSKNWGVTLWNLLNPFSLYPLAKNMSEAQAKAAEGAATAAFVEHAQGKDFTSADQKEMMRKANRKNRGSILLGFLGSLGLAGGEIIEKAVPGPIGIIGLLGGLGVGISGLFGAIRKRSEAMVAGSEAGIMKAVANQEIAAAHIQAGQVASNAHFYSPKIMALSSEAAPLAQHAQSANEAHTRETPSPAASPQQRTV